MQNIYDDLRGAYGFLLRLPLPIGAKPLPPLSAKSLWACVPIGFLVGAMAALGAAILQAAGLSDRWVAWFIIGFMALISGGLHEDGLADVLDGFFGGKDAPTRLKIMKDPHIGIFGMLGLIVLKSMEAEWLTIILQHEDGLVFVAALAGVSRGYWGLALQDTDSLATDKASLAHKLGTPSLPDISLSLGLAGGLLLLSASLATAIVLWGGLLVLCFIWARFCRHKIAGINGDCLGALQQLGFLTGLTIYTIMEIL